MSAWRQIFLVARRDFIERLTSKAFLMSTGVTFLVVIGLVAFPAIVSGNEDTWVVAVTSDVPTELEAALPALTPEGTQVEIDRVADPAEVERRVEEGEATAGVAGDVIVVGADTPLALQTALRGAVSASVLTRRAAELGVDPATLTEILSAADVEVRRVGEEPEGPLPDEGPAILAFIATIFLFISIVTYGQWILLGVIEEKSNRVVEVVLGAVSAPRLLAGKVLGIGALGFGQLALLAAIAFATARASSGFELPESAPETVLAILVWFVLGYAFYATAYAAVGSLVTRQEEAQNAAFPLTILLTGAYIVTSSVVFSGSDDSALLRIMSLLPPFAPMTMPSRIAVGSAAGWEIAVSLILMVAAVWLMIRLAARIYMGGLLSTRSRVKLREAWRSAEL